MISPDVKLKARCYLYRKNMEQININYLSIDIEMSTWLQIQRKNRSLKIKLKTIEKALKKQKTCWETYQHCEIRLCRRVGWFISYLQRKKTLYIPFQKRSEQINNHWFWLFSAHNGSIHFGKKAVNYNSKRKGYTNLDRCQKCRSDKMYRLGNIREAYHYIKV